MYLCASEEPNYLYSAVPQPSQDLHPLGIDLSPKDAQVFLLYCVHPTNHFCYEDVLQLADLLYKCGGVRCKFDGYDRSNPSPSNWSNWTEKMICESDHVLMVCSEALRNAFQRAAHDFVHMKRGKFYADVIVNTISAPKFIPVFLNSRECLRSVPMALQAATSYELRVKELCNAMGNTEGMALSTFNQRLEAHLGEEKYEGIASLIAQLRKEPLVLTPPQTPEVVPTPCTASQSCMPRRKLTGNAMHAVVCSQTSTHLSSICLLGIYYDLCCMYYFLPLCWQAWSINLAITVTTAAGVTTHVWSILRVLFHY